MSIDMTTDEAEAFLADVHIGILAIEHDGHGPLALPIWYQFTDGVVVISMAEDSLKAKLLRRAGRATMTVQTEEAPYRYVSVEGPVTLASEDHDVEAMATRYLGAELGKWYAENNSGDGSVVVRLRPERWRTTDYAKSLG